MNPLNPAISDWKSRKVWIIGASSGIGAALAKALSRQGALLALSARRPAELQSLATASDLVLPLDVTDTQAIQHANDRIQREWGRIDLVIYCAGTYRPMRAWDIDLPLVEETLSINLQGAFNMLHTVVPGLLQQGAGGICLVSSAAGYTGLPRALAYGPSKAALINLAQVLYGDLSPRGIGVYLVNPGFVQTRLTQQNEFAMPALVTPSEAAASILHGFSRGRFEIHFPGRFTRWMKLLACLPDRLRFSLIKRVTTE
jgi:short-subunit dehydrogenase